MSRDEIFSNSNNICQASDTQCLQLCLPAEVQVHQKSHNSHCSDSHCISVQWFSHLAYFIHSSSSSLPRSCFFWLCSFPLRFLTSSEKISGYRDGVAQGERECTSPEQTSIVIGFSDFIGALVLPLSCLHAAKALSNNGASGLPVVCRCYASADAVLQSLTLFIEDAKFSGSGGKTLCVIS